MGTGTRSKVATMGTAAIAALALALAGCGSSDAATSDGTSREATTSTTTAGSTTTTDEAQPALDGKQFQATSISGAAAPAGYDLILEFKGNELFAYEGCNVQFAPYRFRDGVLAWDKSPRSFFSMCPFASNQQDIRLEYLAEKGLEATLDGSTLTLEQDDVTVTLDQVEPLPIRGTTWTGVNTFGDGAQFTQAPVPDGVEPPTLKIDDDGTVEFFDGCNTATTTATIENGLLTVRPVPMTEKTCDPATEAYAKTVRGVVFSDQAGIANAGDSFVIAGDHAGMRFTGS